MFRDAVLISGQEPDPAIVRQLSNVFGFAGDPVTALRIRRMFRCQAQYGDTQVRIESAQFLDRVRNSGHEIADDRRLTKQIEVQGSSAEPRYSWVLDYIPRALPCDAEVTANVRFRNVGMVPFRHQPPYEVRLCVFWFNESGEKIEAPDRRTPLPLTIPPGREITLPIYFRTPGLAGRMHMQLTMVQEGIRFLHDDSKRIPVRLGSVCAPTLPKGWVRHDLPKQTYNDDHARGQELLGCWLGALETPRPRVLEVGGNASPMIRDVVDADLYNLDVDLLGLQIAAIAQRTRQQDIACLCADAENLPFPPRFFDAIILFATLHHFPEPARLLSHLATRLRPGGFIGVFCEPVGHIDPGGADAMFLAELMKGVNEQSFTAAEYEAIFLRARLRVEAAVIDRDSLKARLVPFD